MKPGKGLARTKPLVARTGLARTASLLRTAGLARGRPNRDRTSPQRQARAAQLATWADVRAVALERDQWTCVGCGLTDLELDVHHRRRKGMGGSKLLDLVENAVSLHGPGNTAGCHGWAHRYAVQAAAVGLVVPEGVDPATWPIRYPDVPGGGTWLLTADGGRVAA